MNFTFNICLCLLREYYSNNKFPKYFLASQQKHLTWHVPKKTPFSQPILEAMWSFILSVYYHLLFVLLSQRWYSVPRWPFKFNFKVQPFKIHPLFTLELGPWVNTFSNSTSVFLLLSSLLTLSHSFYSLAHPSPLSSFLNLPYRQFLSCQSFLYHKQ